MIAVGDWVVHDGQDSTFAGVAVAMFRKFARDLSGPVETWRVVVQNADGLLHVYRPEQLTLAVR